MPDAEAFAMDLKVCSGEHPGVIHPVGGQIPEIPVKIKIPVDDRTVMFARCRQREGFALVEK